MAKTPNKRNYGATESTLINIRALKKQVVKLTELVRQLLGKRTKAARRAK